MLNNDFLFMYYICLLLYISFMFIIRIINCTIFNVDFTWKRDNSSTTTKQK